MKIYKIRRKSDGLFSTGGLTPRFTKTGKTWNQIGHLKSHFTLLNEDRDYIIKHNEMFRSARRIPDGALEIYEGCEIVEIETETISTDSKEISCFTSYK